MRQIHNNTVKAGGGFSLTGPYPIDDRLVYQSRADLDTAPYTYEGIEIYVLDEKKSYKLTADGWQEVITRNNLPVVDVSSDISEHNTSADSHQDIRNLIKSSTDILDELTKDIIVEKLGYTPPEQDTTYDVATTEEDGLLSSSDKEKLDSLATVATSGKYTDLLDIPSEFIPVEHGHDEYLLIETAEKDYIPISQKGEKGGVATLDSDGLVPISQLPSYVDDVIEVQSFEQLPEEGLGNKIYITLDDNLTYRWGGSSYVEISKSLALGETSNTAFDGERGLAAFEHSKVVEGNPHNVTSADLGLENVENKSSETIRSELTKDNITNALGYAPPTTSEVESILANKKAIIDVLELPTDGLDEGVLYRLLTAKFMSGRELVTEEYGENSYCRCVETLPEVGDVCTDAQMTFVNVYYSVADNAIYGYVDDELAQVFNTSSGWQSIETLCAIANITWGGIITTKEEDSGDGEILYILLAYEFYTYKDGWTKLIMSQEKQPKFDIQWNGNTDGKFVLDMTPLGFDYTYFVKVSDQVFTIDELIGSKVMQTSGFSVDIDTSHIDDESYPGALSLGGGAVICYDASTLNAALGLPEGYITNGTYFVYVHDEAGDIIYTHRLVGRACITKIDSKYLDHTDILDTVEENFNSLHSVAWNGDYNFLNNRPTIYTDVVRHGSSQSLSNSQKLTARNNIDVYSKSEVDNFLPYTIGLNYQLNLNSTEYSVIGIGSSTDTRISIPSMYNGLPVTSVGESAFYDCTSLTSIEIPDSVTWISYNAFRKCTSLTSIEIPDSVTWIGSEVFASCTSLTSIEIPNSVTSIGDYAFSGCTSLRSIEIPDSVTGIGNYAFRDCTSITRVETGDSVNSIGNSAFSGCTSLASVTIGDSVTSIGSYAFQNCSSLTDVYYTGTQEQWNAINITESGNSYLLNATIRYNFANDFISVNEQLENKADKSSLSTVATSGSYNDLLDKPTIPTDTNTSHEHEAGVGLAVNGDAGISEGTVTYKANLKSEDKATVESIYTQGADANRLYAVQVDKDGKLAVNVPWTDTSLSEADVKTIAATEINTLIDSVSDADTIENINSLVTYVNTHGTNTTALITEVYGTNSPSGTSRIDTLLDCLTWGEF